MSSATHAPGNRPLIFGHRGMRGAPENTLPAFERAIAAGADGVELDVRVCKGGEVVVMHDANLRRTAGLPDEVAELDYADLRRVVLGGGDARAYAPLLSEVLAYVLPLGKHVNVEIKADAPALSPIVQGVVRELAARPAHERARVVVSSFEAKALSELRALDAETAVGFLYSTWREAELAPQLTHCGEHPKHTLLDESALAKLRARAQFVNTWTVNDAQQALKLAALGVDAIISDVPDVLLAAFAA